MNTSANTLPAAVPDSKPLWAAIGVLGVAVVALGASLVYVQSRPVDGHAALAAISSHTPTAPSNTQPVGAPESLSHREDLVEPPKPPKAAARVLPAVPVARPTPAAAPMAAAPVRSHAPAPIPAPAVTPVPAPAPAPSAVAVTGAGSAPATDAPGVVTSSGVIPSQPAPARPTCVNCGVVEAVTPIQRNAKSGTGVGAVAGGALGAVVGNQIGKGGGRALATILGAVGGGIAGNAVEKNMKKETIYQVQVRMEDGSLRSVEQASAISVGSRVTLDGSVLHPAEQRATARPPRVVPDGRIDSPQPDDRV